VGITRLEGNQIAPDELDITLEFGVILLSSFAASAGRGRDFWF
jgi:hypothetical protein